MWWLVSHVVCLFVCFLVWQIIRLISVECVWSWKDFLQRHFLATMQSMTWLTWSLYFLVFSWTRKAVGRSVFSAKHLKRLMSQEQINLQRITQAVLNSSFKSTKMSVLSTDGQDKNRFPWLYQSPVGLLICEYVTSSNSVVYFLFSLFFFLKHKQINSWC